MFAKLSYLCRQIQTKVVKFRYSATLLWYQRGRLSVRSEGIRKQRRRASWALTATRYPDGARTPVTGWRGSSGGPVEKRSTLARICSGSGRNITENEHLRVMRRTAGDGFKHKFLRERETLKGAASRAPNTAGWRRW